MRCRDGVVAVVAPYLTIYTPTYKRPRLLADCMASVAMQTVPPLEHIIVADYIGIGIARMYQEIEYRANSFNGDYVYILQDDDMLKDQLVIEDFYNEVYMEQPPVVIARNYKGKRLLPDKGYWEQEPKQNHIDLSGFIIRNDVFYDNRNNFGRRYEGDFDFIHSLWGKYPFHWWDRAIAFSQQIGKGEPEDDQG